MAETKTYCNRLGREAERQNPIWVTLSLRLEKQAMATYVILSKLSPELREPKELRQLVYTVAQQIKDQCPNVRWKASYALMGRFDVVDIVEAENPSEVEMTAMIIRAYGHAVTETMHATPWKEFLSSL